MASWSVVKQYTIWSISAVDMPSRMFSEIIQQGRVDFGACADTANCSSVAECASHRQFISFFLIMLNFWLPLRRK